MSSMLVWGAIFVIGMVIILKSPGFIKLKIYHVSDKKISHEELPIIVKPSIVCITLCLWAILGIAFSIAQILGNEPLGISIIIGILLSAIPSALLTLIIVFVLFSNQAIFDIDGITIKGHVFNKNTFIPWNLWSVEYYYCGREFKTINFHSCKMPKNMLGLTVTPFHTKYIECLLYAIKRIPKDCFSENAQKKLKKMGIGNWDETNDVTQKVKKNKRTKKIKK